MTGSPARLVAASFAGGILASSSVLLGRQAHFHHVLIVPVAAGLLAGYAMLLLAGQRLRSGICGGRWTEPQLSALRRFRESKGWMAVSVLFLFAMVCCLLPHSGRRGPFWALFILLQAMQQITLGLREPKPSTPSTLDLSGSSPLQSRHWGLPSQPSA